MQVVPYYAPAWGYGGPPRVMFNLAKGLIARGHKVIVYTTDAYERNSRIRRTEDVINGVRIHYFRNLSNWLAYKKRFVPLGFRTYLKRNIKEFDIIHLSETRTYLSIVTYFYARRNHIPLVFSAYGSLPRRKEGLKTIYDFFFVKPLIKNSTLLLAQTEHEVEEYLKFTRDKEKIFIIPLPIDLSEFSELPRRGLFRERYGITREDKLLLFLGRIHFLKGVHLLIDMMRILSEQDSRVKLVLAGRDDGYLHEVQNRIKKYHLEKKVIFVGPLYGTDKLMAYVDADLFIHMPITYEETPTAALEACACYTPAMVTKEASIPWLEDYKAGSYIPHDEVKASEMVMSLLEDERKLERYSNNARRLIEEKFELHKVVESLERKFLEVAVSQQLGSSLDF